MIFKVQKIQQNTGRQKEKLGPGVSHLISPISTKVQRCSYSISI